MRRKTDARFAVTAVILIVLTVIFALTLKYKQRQEDPSVQTEQDTQTGDVQLDQEQLQEFENAGESQADQKEEQQPVISMEEVEAQRAAFVTNYTSAPLLSTTPIKYLTMQQGGQPGEVNFNWFSPSNARGQVVLYNTATGETRTINASTTASATEPGYYYNKAAVTGLQEETTYSYKVGNAAGWSPVYSFTTEKFTGDFTFLVASDAQIGQSEMEVVQDTIDRWDKVVTRVTSYVPNAAFFAHLGDQVAAYNEPTHYTGFFEHLGLYTIPMAPVVGNHDVDGWGTGGGPWFYERYNVPNRSTIGCNWADTDGDYWFRYGDVLFMVLNTSSIYGHDVHAEFVEQACAANQDAKWRIVMGHYSSYSSATKYQADSETYRAHYAYLGETYDIDLFLSGHDHAYTRTKFMNGACEPIEGYDYQSGSTAKNPEGTLFVTLGTASGCTYQPITENYAAALQSQPMVPTAMKVEVTDTTLKLTTYMVDSWVAFDEYTIQKD